MPTLTETRSIAYRQTFEDAGFTAGMQAAAESAKRMARETEAAGAEVDKVERQVTRAGPSIATLNNRIDENAKLAERTAAANRKFAAEMGTLQLAVDKGTKTQAEAGEAERRLAILRDQSIARAQQQAAAQRALFQSADAGTASFKGLGSAIGSAGFQIQDAAVQIQGGTAALTVLAQQGSQFLGVFGTGGAVAGAALALGAVGLQVFGLAGKMETLDDVLKEQTGTYGRLQDAAKLRVEGIKAESEAVEGLRAGYTAMGEANARAEQIVQQRTANKLATQGGDLTRQLGGSLPGQLQQQELGAPSFDVLGNSTGFTQGAGSGPKLASDIAAAVQAYKEFAGSQALTVDSLRGFIAALDEASKAAGGNTAEIRKLRDGAIDALPQVAELEKAYRQQAVQAAALRLATGESAEAIIASAAAAGRSGGSFAGLTAEIVRAAQALNALRQAAVDDPLAAVNAAAANAVTQLAALESGGSRAYDAVKNGQERQAQITALATKTQTEFVAALVLTGVSAEEAARRGEEGAAGFVAGAARSVQAAGAVADKLVQVKKAEADAETARRAAQSAAAKEAREAEAAGEKAQRQAERLDKAWSSFWDNAEKRAEQRAARSQESEDTQGRQNALLEKEIELVGKSDTERTKAIAVFSEQQRIVTEARGNEAALDTETARRRVTIVEQTATLTSELKRQQQAMSDLQSIGTQAFDRIGSALTEAFVQGRGKAVNFGTVVKGILAELAQQVLKLAVLRPILNQLFGTNQATLGDAVSLLNGNSASSGTASGGAASSGGGLLSSLRGGSGSSFSVFGGLGSLSSVGNVFSSGTGASGAGMFSGFKDTINGWGQSLGISGSGLQGPTLSGEALGSASLTQSLGSAGAALGPIGASMALGSAAASLTTSIRGTADPMPAQIAGILGGPIAGIIAGLFGPTTKGMQQRSGGDVAYANIGGQLQVVGAGGKRTDTAANIAQVQQQLAQINANLAQRGLTIGGPVSGMIGFGQASKNPTSLNPNSLTTLLRSDNANVQTALNNAGTRSLEQLLGEVDFVRQVYEPATRAAKGASTLQQSLEALWNQFAPVIDRANTLGLATGDLTAAWDKAIKTATDANAAAIRASDETLAARQMRLSGNAQGADLLTFDTQARAEATAYRTQLEAWGIAASDVAQRMTTLEQVQGGERLAIVQQYAAAQTAAAKTAADAATQLAEQQAQAVQSAAGNAAGLVTSLSDYVRNLRTGSNSPISAQGQYSAASGAFSAVLGAASAGDANSLGKVSTYADAYLSASRAINGSGAGYAADFSRVLDALSSLAAQTPDALTAQVFQAETRTQTEVLRDELAALRDELQGVRRELQMNGLRPAA